MQTKLRFLYFKTLLFATLGPIHFNSNSKIYSFLKNFNSKQYLNEDPKGPFTGGNWRE
jgi:hypothetical protein